MEGMGDVIEVNFQAHKKLDGKLKVFTTSHKAKERLERLHVAGELLYVEAEETSDVIICDLADIQKESVKESNCFAVRVQVDKELDVRTRFFSKETMEPYLHMLWMIYCEREGNLIGEARDIEAMTSSDLLDYKKEVILREQQEGEAETFSQKLETFSRMKSGIIFMKIDDTLLRINEYLEAIQQRCGEIDLSVYVCLAKEDEEQYIETYLFA